MAGNDGLERGGAMGSYDGFDDDINDNGFGDDINDNGSDDESGGFGDELSDDEALYDEASYDDESDDDESDDDESDDGSGDERSDDEPIMGSDGELDDGVSSEQAELIRELHLMGYVGDDVSALARDVRSRRESADLEALSEERRISNRDGKDHIRPLRRARGIMASSPDGITERQVISFCETVGCSRDRSRRLLAKHARLMNGK